MKPRNIALLFFSCILSLPVFITGCGNETKETNNHSDSTSVATGRFFTISDLHFNPYYDSTLVMKLVQSDVQGWKAIFQSSLEKACGVYGEDSDFPLLESAFAGMRSVNAKPDFIVITGDFLGHDFQSDYVKYTGITNTDSVNSFIKKTIQFIALEIGNTFPGIPVYPVLGNNDDYCGDYMIQPKDPFLPMFAQTWAPFLDAAKGTNTFSQTFPEGGYYMANLPGFPDHVIIGLNTIFFSPKDTSTCLPADSLAAKTELNWLTQTLAACAQQQKKVWFTCHIPPGADVYSSLKHQGDTKECEDHIKMMWKNKYSTEFFALEEQYQNIIMGGLAGHTHMDDFRVVQSATGKPVSFFHINPSISPIFSNNPGFQLFTYDTATMALLNYNTYAFQGIQNASDQSWKMEYDFGKTYNVKQFSGQSLGQVWQTIYSDSTVRGNYLNYYSMGSAAAKPSPWKPYWCGIGNLNQAIFGECACEQPVQ